MAIIVEAATLTNVTITENEGGIAGSRARLRNTILGPSTNGRECGVPPISLGHNIDYGTTCGLGTHSDLSGTDPMLERLAANGGPTETHALMSGSPAIDAGDGRACPPADQRGVARVGICDIGAYESQ